MHIKSPKIARFAIKSLQRIIGNLCAGINSIVLYTISINILSMKFELQNSLLDMKIQKYLWAEYFFSQKVKRKIIKGAVSFEIPTTFEH